MNHASKMSVAITLLASIAALSSAMAEAAKPVESTANPTARRVGVEVYVERAQHESTANPTARTAGAESPEAQRIAFEATTVAPLSGVDVKLGKNPGGILATRTTDSNGKIDWGVLAKGSYYLRKH